MHKVKIFVIAKFNFIEYSKILCFFEFFLTVFQPTCGICSIEGYLEKHSTMLSMIPKLSHNLNFRLLDKL